MYCPICNTALNGENFCPNCGQAIDYSSMNQTTAPAQTYAPTYQVVPNEIKRWNWGAFMFNMMWGIGNKTYLPLLCLIPYFNFVWIFVCGIKGNEWAWKSGNYGPNDIEKFLTIQKTWNRAGVAQFIISIAAFVLIIILSIVLSVLAFAAFDAFMY
ncbi:MAG: hypothetical protein ACRCTE_05025 [Cellulosilyticaceae bacterium]